MFRLQHQFNNIVEKTQLTNDQMSEFHCHCKCSKCPPPAPTQAFSRFEKSFTALSIGPCGRLPQITWCLAWVGRLSSALFEACVKPPTLHPTHDSPLDSYGAEFESHSSLVTKSGQLARSQFCALRGVARSVRWRAVLLEDESCSRWLL